MLGERVQQVHGSKGGAESWEFSLSSWVGAFVYCSVACCGETVLKLGSGDKHLRYALNKLSTGLLFQSCLHHKHFLVCLDCVAGREVRWPQEVTAWVGALVSRPSEFDVVLCLSGFLLNTLFSVFRWLDGLVAVVSVR